MTRRSRRNLARLAGLALVAVALALFATSGPAGADGPGATLAAKGWWWRAQDSSLPTALPAPPNVQPGQLEVQGNPADPKGTAYAAVRYTLEAGHTATSLSLKVGANGDEGGTSAVLLACRTGSAWTPADAGAWNAAPKVDLTACVNGQRSADGAAWTFAVGPLALPNVLDVAIVPGVDPATKQTSLFSLVFDAPGADALTTVAGSGPQLPPTTANPALQPATSGATSGRASGVSHPVSVPTVASALPADKVGETATSAANQAASQPALGAALLASPSKNVDKRAGYIVLAFAAAVALYAWRQDNLMALNGGRLPGESEVSGLGRFAQTREGQPPALT